MKLLRRPLSISYAGTTLLLAIFFSLVINLPFYTALADIFSKLESVKLGFIISLPFFLIAALNFLFNIFSWPYITKPFFSLLLVASSIVCYASYNYGTLFDSDMIANIVETDSSEVGAYASAYSVLWIAILGGIPAFLLCIFGIQPPKSWGSFILRKVASMLISIAVIGIIAVLYYQDYASVGRNNSYLKSIIIPTSYIHGGYKYVKKNYLSSPLEYRIIGEDAKQTQKATTQAQKKPTLLVFVLGETARAHNYELNGYAKPTNPYTRHLDVISFKNVSTCGTATAVSVPCMFSAMEKSNFDREKADHSDNALDILQRANVSVLWKENDGGDKMVAKNVKKIEIDRKRVDSFCNGETCYDMALLESFEQDINRLQGNRVVVMHIMGSHGPTYYRRYPKSLAHFQPDCPRSDIENCSIEQIVNSYDNTIAYTDYVLAHTISKLKSVNEQYNTALIYISDHGESLGENGLFLHGMPYGLAPSTQTHVPLIIWMSQGFKQAKNMNEQCLNANAQSQNYSQDNIFHSLLGIMDVETTAYRRQMDLFASCRS
ncbi:phosphoethanolamine--lipid A transferase [Vibrio fluvialis]|nr:phosphoethanolamine--lipid A transferase [Vibrio fluvialis]MBY7972782.1 phosphoethanolamine--lipid A transferase [Vibrio fluvialis]